MIPDHAGSSESWPNRDVLTRRAATTPDRLALVDVETDRRWSYRDLDRAVEELASDLPGGPGDRVAILSDTRPAFVAMVFAAMRVERTLVPCNLRETPAEIASKLARAGVSRAYYTPETAPLVDPVLDALEDSDTDHGTSRSVGADGALPTHRLSDAKSVGRLEAISADDSSGPASNVTASGANAPFERDSGDDGVTDLLIVFTSGTTGEPKGVRLTAANLLTSATASAFRLGVDPADRWLCCLPMYHVGGLAPVIRSTLYGTTTVIQRAFDPERTAAVMGAYDVTGVSLVPTMCKRLLEAGWHPPDALRFVLLGGAPASSALLERCRERGVPAYPTYGMTEAASQIATATPAETAIHEGTVGQPLLCTRVTLLDPAGEPVDAGEVGEIVVDGPTITPGYLEAEIHEADGGPRTQAFGEDGLRTGDLGRRDSDGRLWVVGRVDDRIVTGGENVDPVTVAETLETHPSVTAAAVVGLPDPEWGQRVAALVASQGDLEPAPLNAHCRDRLAGFECPKTIGVVESLPRTHSGTIDREAVVDALEAVGVDLTGS